MAVAVAGSMAKAEARSGEADGFLGACGACLHGSGWMGSPMRADDAGREIFAAVNIIKRVTWVASPV